MEARGHNDTMWRAFSTNATLQKMADHAVRHTSLFPDLPWKMCDVTNTMQITYAMRDSKYSCKHVEIYNKLEVVELLDARAICLANMYIILCKQYFLIQQYCVMLRI